MKNGGMNIMRRRASREFVMKLVYQMLIHKNDLKDVVDDSLKKQEHFLDVGYMESIIYGIMSSNDELNKIIENNLKGWKLSRISKIDLAILQIAVYEITKMEDIPDNVTINEAVELAKKYSCSESASFINGVLSNVLSLHAHKVNNIQEDGHDTL